MTPPLRVLAVAVVLVAAPLGAREPIEELPCDETEFADMTAVDCDFVEAFLDTDFAEVAGCELDRLRVSRHGAGFVVRARWRQCEDSTLLVEPGRPPPRRLRLRLESDAGCLLLSGMLRGRGIRQPVALMPVVALEEQCEAMLDEDDGDDDLDDDDDDFDDDDDDFDEEAAAPAGTLE